MVRFLGFFSLCACLPFLVFAEESTGAEELPTLKDVFDGFVEANGGHTNIQGISSIIVSGRIDSGDGAEQVFKLYRKRPDLMRLRVELDDFSVDTTYDGESAYRRIVGEMGKGEYLPLDEFETETIKQDSAIEGPFYVLARDYGALELTGLEEVRGVECYRLDVAEDHASSVRSVWVSAEEYREMKLLKRGKDTDGQFEEQSVYFSDFQKVHGLSVAQSIEYWKGGKKIQSLYIDEIRVNAGLFDRFFGAE